MEDENKKQEEENKKIGFFRSVFYSITNIEKYPEMVAQGVPTALKYLAKLMVIFAIIICAGLVYQAHSLINKGADFIENELPDISYNDGILTVDSEDAITIKEENSIVDYIIIDTNTTDEEQIDEYVNSIPQDESGVVILKDKAIVKSNAVTTATEYSYEDLIQSVSSEGIESATKQDIINYLTSGAMSFIYLEFFIVMFVYIFIIYLLSVLVDCLVLAILGNITTLLTKLRIRFSAIFNMSVYALTLSIILNALYIVVNMITGFEVKYFQVMYTSIAYIYLVATIFIIKTDFTKKQGELMKIIEEQEKVKDEMADGENEKEEEKEKEQDNEKKDEKEEKKEKEKNNGEEPRGSEA